MGEFNENYDSESVDISNDSSFETSDTEDYVDLEEYNDNSSETFNEDQDLNESENEESQVNSEYAEEQSGENDFSSKNSFEGFDTEGYDDLEEDDDNSSETFEEDQDLNDSEYEEQQAEVEVDVNSEYTVEQSNESELSPAELYERGQQEAKDAQDEAERWANDNNSDTWSNGTSRKNYDDFQTEYETEQQDETNRQADYDAERYATLEADVLAQSDALNKEYMDLMDRKQAAFDSTIDASSIEDRNRFADEQYRIGEQMEQVRSRIIENNNRLK